MQIHDSTPPATYSFIPVKQTTIAVEPESELDSLQSRALELIDGGDFIYGLRTSTCILMFFEEIEQLIEQAPRLRVYGVKLGKWNRETWEVLNERDHQKNYQKSEAAIQDIARWVDSRPSEGKNATPGNTDLLKAIAEENRALKAVMSSLKGLNLEDKVQTLEEYQKALQSLVKVSDKKAKYMADASIELSSLYCKVRTALERKQLDAENKLDKYRSKDPSTDDLARKIIKYIKYLEDVERAEKKQAEYLEQQASLFKEIEGLGQVKISSEEIESRKNAIDLELEKLKGALHRVNQFQKEAEERKNKPTRDEKIKLLIDSYDKHSPVCFDEEKAVFEKVRAWYLKLPHQCDKPLEDLKECVYGYLRHKLLQSPVVFSYKPPQSETPKIIEKAPKVPGIPPKLTINTNNVYPAKAAPVEVTNQFTQANRLA